MAGSQGREAIGIDVGGTNLRVARIAATGEILGARSERISRDPARAFERIVAMVAAFDPSTASAIGIGVPGRVDVNTRRMLSGGFLDFSGLDPVAELEAQTACPVFLDTDCNMALVAEMTVGAARGSRDVAMLTIGTGIGGAIACNGSILRGRASAGQLGHLTVVHDGEPCACGRRGCVETTSSGTALARLIARASLPPETRVETLLAAPVESVEGQVVTIWAAPLRDAIDSLVAVLDPEIVLIGGGLGRAALEAVGRIPERSPCIGPACARPCSATMPASSARRSAPSRVL